MQAATSATMLCDVACLRLAAGNVFRARNSERPPIADAVRAAERILLVALAEIGDAVLLSPFVRALRETAPAAFITLVTRPVVAPLFALCPYIDDVLEYEPRAPRALRPLVLPGRARSFARSRLRARDFDIAIMPRWDTDHHFATAVALFSGARRRVAYSERVNPRKQTLNAGFDRLVTDIVEDSPGIHEVEHHRHMIRSLGGTAPCEALETWVGSDDLASVEREFERAGVPRHVPLIALGIGAADPKRRWPAERFAEVGAALRDRFDAHLLVIGGPDDIEAQSTIVRAIDSGITPLAGALTLRQTAAALGRCGLFVGNDSGPLHLAAARGVPCVEISCHSATGDPRHYNSPERFAPWGVPSVVLRPSVPAPPCLSACAGRGAHCILGLSTDTVLAACELLLGAAAVCNCV